jgi:hypothetical protein
MSSKSKTKGSSYEREVAKFLSDKYGEPFVRVPNSGAYIGGTNSHRKNFLDGNQAKSFKGDITPPDTWSHFNAECKNYADFPFHLLLTGECKQLDTWLGQLLAVGDTNDLNILFIKITRKGRYIAVQSKLTWVTDNFLYYTSPKLGDWIIMEFDSFFLNNSTLLKAYSGSTDTTSKQTVTNNNILTIET